jgi:Protein of unknown function (DUF3293)
VVPPVSDDPWVSYARTVVDISSPEGVTLRVRVAPVADEAQWPWPDARAVHVLTAWDPGAERPGPDVNRVRQAALESELLASGLPLFVAAGVDPATGRREEGVAVCGASESQILALGARYGQDAVFAWTPQEWAVVACRGGRRQASGWSLQASSTGILLQPGP